LILGAAPGCFCFSRAFRFAWRTEDRRSGKKAVWDSLEIPAVISHLSAVSVPELKPIAFFAHERGDARVVKRIAAFQDQGRQVLGFTFHRERDKEDVPPAWKNIHLGTTYNRRYFQRLWTFAKCAGALWSHRGLLGGCGVIYVVNTDNAVLALLGRFFSGRRVPLVLELADIQPVMTGSGVVSKILRAVERAVLKRSAMLVTTSPGFVREYFLPVQGYGGEIFLLENKVYPSGRLPAPAVSEQGPVCSGKPWVIGCFGALRCRRSLELMHALAIRLGDRVRFVLRGYPAGTISDEFDGLLGDLPNFQFGGSYFYPDELAELYGEVDFNWAFDMSDPNGNSAWLLPNRIYEGGFFGVPVLGAKETETGRWIERQELGWTFAEPLEENLARFFESLEPAEWKLVKRRCASHPRGEFTGESDYAALVARMETVTTTD
jgi:succinoglycan biosynthesis protein ExoL